MGENSSDHSRRGFIKKSAIALTGLGGLGYATSRQPVNAQSDARDPRVNYPWQVDVGAPARISLYLTQDCSVEQLVVGNLKELAERMVRRVKSSPTPPELDEALAQGGETVENLNEALLILQDVLKAAEANAEYSLQTYLDYATTLQDTHWDSDVRAALEYLAHFISVPLLHVKPDDVVDFMSEYAKDFENFAGTRNLKSLFTTRCVDFLDDTELQMFHTARDVGLIWCAPRGRFAPRDAEVLARASAKPKPPVVSASAVSSSSIVLAIDNKTRLGDARRSERRIPRAPMVLADANNRACSSGPQGSQCVVSNGHYCQMVDGNCNTMSTP